VLRSLRVALPEASAICNFGKRGSVQIARNLIAGIATECGVPAGTPDALIAQGFQNHIGLSSTHSMQCTACRTHSNNLREYSRVVTIREHRKTIETAYLCPVPGHE
jgi:hypothetical protein